MKKLLEDNYSSQSDENLQVSIVQRLECAGLELRSQLDNIRVQLNNEDEFIAVSSLKIGLYNQDAETLINCLHEFVNTSFQAHQNKGQK
jgi:hypothetical protein